MTSSSPSRQVRQGHRTRIRYCPLTEKVCYPRRKEALRVLNALRHQSLDAQRLHGVYKCPACGRWHLTKQETA